jgi:hypothetical protein
MENDTDSLLYLCLASASKLAASGVFSTATEVRIRFTLKQQKLLPLSLKR